MLGVSSMAATVEMAPPCRYDVAADDWYRALDDFIIPPLCSSPSIPMSVLESHLPIAAVPPGGHSMSFSHHGALAAADCSPSALTTMDVTAMREDDGYYLPAFAAPPPACGDQFQFCSGDQLAPFPADGATAGLDDALLLPFSDIDLEAFGGGDDDAGDDKASLHRAVAIVPAEQHPVPPPPIIHNAGGADAVHVHHHHESKAIVVAGYSYPPSDDPSSNGFETAVVRQQHHEAAPVVVAAPPAPPRPRGRRSASGGGDPRSAPRPYGNGKTRLDHIGFDELRKYFYMPITRAAREMGVGLTVLKKRCRELGVARWPHRKMKSLRSLILNVQKMGNGGMSAAEVQRELAALETYCALMEEDPSIEITDRTKKLRQACFKESYKRRRAAAGGVTVDQILSFGGGHHHQLPMQAAAATSSDAESSSFFGY